MVYAPPGTAIFHQRSQGWTVGDHLQAQAIDALNQLVWFKTTDAQRKVPRHRPQQIQRPGMQAPEPPPQQQEERSMTVAEYVARTGINVNLGD